MGDALRTLNELRKVTSLKDGLSHRLRTAVAAAINWTTRIYFDRSVQGPNEFAASGLILGCDGGIDHVDDLLPDGDRGGGALRAAEAA